MKQLRQQYAGQCSFQLVMGGLRAGNTQPMDQKLRDYVLDHWRNVHRASGQPFNFDFMMPPGFIYDTEPACRAVKTADRMVPSPGSEVAFRLMEAIQRAFYVDNMDVTQEGVLVEKAVQCGLDGDAFQKLFRSHSMKQATQEDFDRSRQLTTTGFPTLVGVLDGRVTTLAPGYATTNQLIPAIDKWLAPVSAS
jgi:putative protein-disulfide isomerase